jgi:hypothetical protein
LGEQDKSVWRENLPVHVMDAAARTRAEYAFILLFVEEMTADVIYCTVSYYAEGHSDLTGKGLDY